MGSPRVAAGQATSIYLALSPNYPKAGNDWNPRALFQDAQCSVVIRTDNTFRLSTQRLLVILKTKNKRGARTTTARSPSPIERREVPLRERYVAPVRGDARRSSITNKTKSDLRHPTTLVPHPKMEQRTVDLAQPSTPCSVLCSAPSRHLQLGAGGPTEQTEIVLATTTKCSREHNAS